MSSSSPKNVLVLGASGMLGHVVLETFALNPALNVFGSVRSAGAAQRLPAHLRSRLVLGCDVENLDSLTRLFAQCRPQLVINCVGLVKQLAEADDPLLALPINSLLPHRLAQLCAVAGARLVHVSTDCVFSGRKGNYTEADAPDAQDLYGRSKLLGEVALPHTITLRTSIIGPELGSAHGLVGWFLAQQGRVKGYRKAIFSGLPTVALARLIHDVVMPRADLHGLHHVSADPINKHDLLMLVARQYGKAIEIDADDAVAIDRSLDSSGFRKATGYVPAPWPELVRQMHAGPAHPNH